MNKLSDLIQASFRTDKATDAANTEFKANLGLQVRYGPARLAIALSLSEKRLVDMDEMTDGEKGTEIKGSQLLGQECPAALTALITQHAGRKLTRQEFQHAVSAHWSRGIKMLRQSWNSTGNDFDKFLNTLIERSGLDSSDAVISPLSGGQRDNKSARAIDLHIGKSVTDGQSVSWRVNAPGGSPHIAVMGGD